MNSYFNTIVIAEWITFIAAIFLLTKRTGKWRLFILFLFLTLCVETIGWYLHQYRKITLNGLPFNILMLVNFSFLLWFLSGYVQGPLKKIAQIAMVLFAATGIINMLFFQGLWIYNIYTEALGDIILALLSCYVLFQLAFREEKVPLATLDYFWLAIALLFSSLGNAILYIFQPFLYRYYLDTHINIGGSINTAINLIFCAALITAFLCRWRTTRSLQVSSFPLSSS